MKIVLTHILEDLRNLLYTIGDRFKRFRAYASLSSGKTRGEPLPLATFSPVGERQAGYLERLIGIDAERLAQKAADEVADDFTTLVDSFRLMLVVADVPRNGWTERHLTDAQWRFTLKDDTLPATLGTGVTLAGFDRWVSVLLWTDTEATESYVRKEVRAALYRALLLPLYWCAPHVSGDDAARGPGASLRGLRPELDTGGLDYSREVVRPHVQSSDFSVCFAALYGDDAARQVGYEALGLTAHAGFQVALYTTLSERTRADLISLLGAAGKPTDKHTDA